MSQVEIASNAIKSWTSSLVGRSLSSSSSSSSSLAGTTATARSKLRYRPRASLDEAYAKGKEVESAASTTGGPPPVRAAAAAAEQPSISSSSSSSSSRDDGGGCNERQRRLLQKKQSTIMQRAQERLGRGEAQQHVLLAYSKLAVKWFQKTTTENPSFDPQKVEGQIQQTLDVFNNFLKEWRMEYLLLPALIYVERYFGVLGSISYQYVFDLFLTSVVLAIKFWHDPVIANTTFSKIFDIPTNVLTFNELNFLYAVDYNLVLDQEHVQTFAKRLSF